MTQPGQPDAVESNAPGLTGEQHTVELVIPWILRIGVWSSVALIAVGVVMLAISDGGALLHAKGSLNDVLKSGIKGQPVSISAYPDVFRAIGRGQAYGVIDLGLLVLVLTPVTRVAVSIVAFLIEKDHLYAAITTLVLVLLLTSILLGRAGG
jgi:uncharacterized membrane protein